MAHGAILAAGVKRLQDDQDRMFFLGVKERLQACEFVPATLDVDCGGLRRFLISLERRINILELQRLSRVDDKPLAIVHGHLLILLRHKRSGGGFWRRIVWQHGHRVSLLARATMRHRLIVAIEFVTCRSGRTGGAAGSIIFG